MNPWIAKKIKNKEKEKKKNKHPVLIQAAS